MSKPIIEINNLSKRYYIKHADLPYFTLRDSLANSAKKAWDFIQTRKFDNSNDEFWALKDVSFSLNQGDILGIIGRNGAGKSTILKILSRITPPTKGTIRLRGRIASLLEVGTGFNPELTGRENIYLNGSILGMTRREIRRKIEEIIDFSGVERFVDTPVKRYSSGMYVRLAFAVAAHLEPEILVVDEVLAVGDAEFQKKCLQKMQDVTSREGRTVLFVSHNMGAIRRLCHKCILLDGGKIKKLGDVREVVDTYLSEDYMQKAVFEYPEDDKKVQIRKVEIVDDAGRRTTELDINKPFVVKVEYVVREDLKFRSQLQIIINDFNDNIAFHTMDVDTNEHLHRERKKGFYNALFRFPSNIFNAIGFKLTIACGIIPKHNAGADRQNYYDLRDDINIFFYNSSNFASKFYKGKRAGIFLLKIPCDVSYDKNKCV